MQTKMYVIQPRIIKVDQTKAQKQRVAVYCRVSKNTSEQIHSLEMQESYFKGFVETKPEWVLYKIYKDIGSGTRKVEEGAILRWCAMRKGTALI